MDDDLDDSLPTGFAFQAGSNLLLLKFTWSLQSASACRMVERVYCVSLRLQRKGRVISEWKHTNTCHGHGARASAHIHHLSHVVYVHICENPKVLEP